MIVLTAHLWPNGSQSDSREILNVTMTNQTPPGYEREQYACHVIARPDLDKGIIGYDADVQVSNHQFNHGLVPVLVAALVGAHCEPDEANIGMYIPPSKTLTRLVLREMHEFEGRLKGRA